MQTPIGDWDSFLTTIWQLLEQRGIDISKYEIDHVGYRTTSLDSFNQFVENMPAEFGHKFGQIEINNRPIANFELVEPLSYKGKSIPYFEVLSPKVGDTYPEGLDHIEVVVEDLNKFMELYPGIEFKQKLDRDINPEIETILSDRYKVKFHQTNLKSAYLAQTSAGRL